MSRSLASHLSRTLALAIILTGLAAGAASFVFAYLEAQEFQDDTLRQIAALARTQSELSPLEGDKALEDPESRVIVLRLPKDPHPDWLPANPGAGFHTLKNADGRLRVFVALARDDARVVVAQATDVRDELAVDSALRTLAPMILLLPLLAWLSVRIVRRELAPVRRLAQALDAQSADRPQSLPHEQLPDEIAPFVRAINRLFDRITRLMTQQRRFIADAAHELRSPLTALSLQAQNMEKAETLETMRERLAPLRAGIERAHRLTEQLLSLAKSQSGTPATAPVDVSKLARELISEYMPLADARAIDLGLEDTGSIVVRADPQALRLVLKNALDNALHYTPKQGEVTVRLFNEGPDAVIEICDSGPGIPAAEKELVFAPFHRGTGASHGGSGLGLSIARDAAARLGGTISLHDRAGGQGLVFRYRQHRAA